MNEELTYCQHGLHTSYRCIVCENARKQAEQARTRALLPIAAKHLQLATLVTQGSDQLDFSEQAVWALKAALEAAYEAGRESAIQ